MTGIVLPPVVWIAAHGRFVGAAIVCGLIVGVGVWHSGNARGRDAELCQAACVMAVMTVVATALGGTWW